jgi:hypothetical protein
LIDKRLQRTAVNAAAAAATVDCLQLLECCQGVYTATAAATTAAASQTVQSCHNSKYI